MGQEGYSRNEVTFLLSLTHEEAIEYASQTGSSLGRLTEEDYKSFQPDGRDVPFIAKWQEVNAARNHIVTHKEHLMLLQLRLEGRTEKEIATLLGVGRRTIGYRWRATLVEILDVLGGEKKSMIMPMDHIDMCLKCRQHPRTQTVKRRRVWINEQWKWRTINRRASVCAYCLEQEKLNDKI